MISVKKIEKLSENVRPRDGSDDNYKLLGSNNDRELCSKFKVTFDTCYQPRFFDYYPGMYYSWEGLNLVLYVPNKLSHQSESLIETEVINFTGAFEEALKKEDNEKNWLNLLVIKLNNAIFSNKNKR